MARIRELVVREERRGGASRRIEAAIERNGDFVLTGMAFGKIVQQVWGDPESEHTRRVAADYKDTMLLRLVKDRFGSDDEFAAWLDTHAIPHRFHRWP